MAINRNNYEQYFLDLIEGRLDLSLKAELEQFLLVNPDLKKELEEFETVSLTDEPSIKFTGKTSLKKNFIPVGEINESNYENFLAGKIENDLSAKENETLEKFLVNNPFIEKEQELFSKTVLVPEKIVFNHKRELKRTAVIRIGWQQAVTAFAVAASILLLLYLNFRKEDFSPGIKNETAEQKKEMQPVPENIKHNDKGSVPDQREENEKNFLAENSPVKEKIIRHREKGKANKEKSAVNSGERAVQQPATVNLQPSAGNPDIPKAEKETEKNNFNEKVAENSAKNYSDEQRPADPVLEESSVKNNRKTVNSDDPFTLKEFLTFSFRKNILKEKEAKKKKDEKLTPFDVASAAVAGASRLFGSKIKMKKQYKDNGELAAVSISSPGFEISRTLHGK